MQAEHELSRKSVIARNGVQAVVWAFGVATVVSAVLAAVVIVIASIGSSDAAGSGNPATAASVPGVPQE